MSDSFICRLHILQMLRRKEESVITIPEIISRLSAAGLVIGRNKTIERDMVYLSSVLNIGCDDTVRPFLWWWNADDSIEIPGMGRNTALTFYLAEQYLKPLLPKQSIEHLQSRFKQSSKVMWLYLTGHTT